MRVCTKYLGTRSSAVGRSATAEGWPMGRLLVDDLLSLGGVLASVGEQSNTTRIRARRSVALTLAGTSRSMVLRIA